ncbi:MAG: hypothetical protein CL591_11900 [Alteromonas sp.]|nr:hypothetical protein [Alteromonas sp.]
MIQVSFNLTGLPASLGKQKSPGKCQGLNVVAGAGCQRCLSCWSMPLILPLSHHISARYYLA